MASSGEGGGLLVLAPGFAAAGVFVLVGGLTRVQFSPPHKKPSTHPCTLSRSGLSRLMLEEYFLPSSAL
jgi:hypothetical protein